MSRESSSSVKILGGGMARFLGKAFGSSASVRRHDREIIAKSTDNPVRMARPFAVPAQETTKPTAILRNVAVEVFAIDVWANARNIAA